MIKRCLFTVGLMLVLITVFAGLASAQTANPGDSIRWEFADADLAASNVIRFEACFNAATPCPSATPAAAKFTPTAVQGGAPAAGFSAYKLLIPGLTTGAQSVVVKACNSAVCSGSSPLSFSLIIVPGLPVNLQIIKS